MTETKFISRKTFKGMMLAATMLASASTFAQQQQTSEEKSLTPKLGVKGGANLSSFYVDNPDVKDQNAKVGYHLGLFAKLPITRGFSIQPELLYTSNGTKQAYSNPLFGSGEYRFNMNYLQLPLLASINLTKNLNIHAGPYAAYLTNANVKDVSNDGTVNDVTKLDANDFNRIDYGLTGGLGFDVQNTTFGLRYNYGLSEVGKDGNFSSQALQNSKNSVLQLFIGFGF